MSVDWNQITKHESLHKFPVSELEFTNTQMVFTHKPLDISISACDHALRSVYFRAFKHMEWICTFVT